MAALLVAVSPAGIDESTFIWNPNLVPFFAALAFGGAIRARQTGRTRWWLVAGLGAMVTMQLHVLGVVVAVPLAWAWAAELWRRRREGRPAGPVVAAGAGALAIIAAGFLPLLVYELGHDFAESRAILAYVAGGGREATSGPRDAPGAGRAAVDHVARRGSDHRPDAGLAGVGRRRSSR